MNCRLINPPAANRQRVAVLSTGCPTQHQRLAGEKEKGRNVHDTSASFFQLRHAQHMNGWLVDGDPVM